MTTKEKLGASPALMISSCRRSRPDLAVQLHDRAGFLRLQAAQTQQVIEKRFTDYAHA